MIIREMMEADLAEVHAIELDSFSEPWSEDDFRDSLRAPSNGYLVAESDGKIVGYCGYWGVAGEGYIYNVAVKREFRKQRVGYQLLNELIERSKIKGIASFTLEVRINNEPAIHLYEALGFERAGVRKDFYTKPKEDAVIMWRKPIQ